MAYRYIPNDQDLNMLKQKIKNVSIKINILNKDFEILSSIKGLVVNDSYTIDVNSDIRRTYSLSLKITKDYDMLDIYKKLWIDKILDVYMGVQDLANNNEFVWYKFGRFTFDTASYEIAADSYYLNVNCLDLVAKYNGLLGGELFDPILIPAFDADTGEPNTIKGAIIKVITQLAGIEKYDIAEMDKYIPHDLEYGRGATIWQIISDLRDLYAGWETYFDTDGVFVCEPIPTGENDPIFLTEEVFNGLIINESDVEDASHIRNFSKLYGRALEYDYYCETLEVTKEEEEGLVFEVQEEFIPENNATHFKAFKVDSLPLEGKKSYVYTPGGNHPLLEIDTKPMDSLDKWYYLEKVPAVSRTGKYHLSDYSYYTKVAPTVLKPVSFEWGTQRIDPWGDDDYRTVKTLTINFGELASLPNPFAFIWPEDVIWPPPIDTIEPNISTRTGLVYVKYKDINTGYESKKYITTRELNSDQEGDKEQTNYNFIPGEVYMIETETWVEYKTYYETKTVTDKDGNKSEVVVEKERRISHRIDHVYTLGFIEETTVQIMDKIFIDLTSLKDISLTNGDTIAFYIPDGVQSNDNPITSEGLKEVLNTPELYLKHKNNLYYVCDEDLKPIMTGIIRKGTLYVYKLSNNNVYFLGEQEIDIIAKEVLKAPTIEERVAEMDKYQCADIIYCVDPDSQFAIELIGERKKVYQDGDYAKIYSTELGIERIVYENWKTTRLNTVSTINNIAIPWLAGNEKIQYRKKVDNKLETYLIKQISGSTKEWTQTLSLVKFYPMIPNVIHSKWV